MPACERLPSPEPTHYSPLQPSSLATFAILEPPASASMPQEAVQSHLLPADHQLALPPKIAPGPYTLSPTTDPHGLLSPLARPFTTDQPLHTHPYSRESRIATHLHVTAMPRTAPSAPFAWPSPITQLTRTSVHASQTRPAAPVRPVAHVLS